MPKITLTNGKSFDAQPGQTILEAAQVAGLLLEHSCKTGRCGVCRAPVPDGATSVIVPETAPEADAGHILTCCRAAQTDLTLDVEDLSALAGVEERTLPCRISSIEQVSIDMVQLWLRTPPASKLTFVPGQHLNLIAPGGLRRAYSIANAPREDGQICLLVRRVEGGQMSAVLFGKAKENDLFRLNGPLGTFHMRKDGAERVIFLATGTGIAPIRAMLQGMAGHGDCANMTVYWGNRSTDDLVWPADDFPGATLIPVLSRAGPEWTGRRGYVQNAALEDGFDPGCATVYACGAPEMIRDARAHFIAAGLPERKFHSDAFVSSEDLA
jgi:CDP-4-dehydro-6-deoxyglucose reductase